ncbi:MAG: hypothetical protein NTW28_34260 [Candidatus Solibacter sp.]|nr:hypothetical protein [Candidatus Solibacter sp.]
MEANQQLGFDDLRNYELPGAILQFFGLKAVRLMSNNPEKVEAVEKAGVQVVERVPCLPDVLDTRLAPRLSPHQARKDGPPAGIRRHLRLTGRASARGLMV